MKEYMFILKRNGVDIVVEVNTDFIMMYDKSTGELYYDSRDAYCAIPELSKVFGDLILFTFNSIKVLSATIDKTTVYSCEVVE